MICNYEGCNKRARYCIEWWGLNQHGKNPHLADECYSCTDPHHLIKLSHNSNLGGYPDEIYTDTPPGVRSKVLPKLLELVKKAMDGELKPDSIENIVEHSDPPKEQLALAFT